MAAQVTEAFLFELLGRMYAEVRFLTDQNRALIEEVQRLRAPGVGMTDDIASR